jgi:hypothetical protein
MENLPNEILRLILDACIRQIDALPEFLRFIRCTSKSFTQRVSDTINWKNLFKSSTNEALLDNTFPCPRFARFIKSFTPTQGNGKITAEAWRTAFEQRYHYEYNLRRMWMLHKDKPLKHLEEALKA